MSTDKQSSGITKSDAQSPVGAGKPSVDAQPQAGAGKPATRQRRRRNGSNGGETPARFFTGDKSAANGIPALKEEYTSEAAAIAASYKLDQPFYRLEVFGARQITENGRVILEKKPLK
jgi:hypothetical protein